jgi:selenocysteine lyase/cysteine desulfurase
VEQLLVSGGDTRLVVNPQTGRNGYECLPRPSGVVPFGSCTSSTVSQRGFDAAQNLQRTICGNHDSLHSATEAAGNVRRRLSELLTLPSGVEVALAPSGTDVEMLALALAAGSGERKVMNIVVGPSEVGSGTPQAAACCHYDRITPSGRQVVAGEPVDRHLASRVDVRTVDLRTAHGVMLPESDIDAAIVELVVEASEADAIVLLHVVAHSKTGVHAPSLTCVERLRTASDDVVVVVDAAQGRFSRRGLRDVLQRNYLVMFTGSKFYGGPPFSGALLVPPRFQPAVRHLNELPAGFADYFTAAEMPESWAEIRQVLPAEPNIGAVLRWSAALAEIEAYYRVPDQLRLQVLRFFEAEVPKVLGASDVIHLLPVFPPVYDETSERLLESKTTVFGFWVTPNGARHSLGKADLKVMHTELASDLSVDHPGTDQPVVARTYHLGQPVDLGPAGSVLRVALGGEMITRLATDERLGRSLDERLDWLRSQLVGLRQKIECLAASRAPATAVAEIAAM